MCEWCSNNLRNKSIRKVQTEGSRRELIFKYLTTTTSLSYWNNPRSKTPAGVALVIIWQYLKTKHFPILDKRPGLLRKLTKFRVPLQWHLKMYMLKTVLMLLCELFYFPHPLPPPHLMWLLKSVCACVCVCVWERERERERLFLSFCLLFSLFYWLSYFCLVTIACLVSHACKMLNENQKTSLLLFFKSPPPILVIIIIYKDRKNHVIFSQCAKSSMCTKSERERRSGKKKKLILQKQIPFQTLSITLILADGSLLFCFV